MGNLTVDLRTNCEFTADNATDVPAPSVTGCGYILAGNRSPLPFLPSLSIVTGGPTPGMRR